MGQLIHFYQKKKIIVTNFQDSFKGTPYLSPSYRGLERVRYRGKPTPRFPNVWSKVLRCIEGSIGCDKQVRHLDVGGLSSQCMHLCWNIRSMYGITHLTIPYRILDTGSVINLVCVTTMKVIGAGPLSLRDKPIDMSGFAALKKLEISAGDFVNLGILPRSLIYLRIRKRNDGNENYFYGRAWMPLPDHVTSLSMMSLNDVLRIHLLTPLTAVRTLHIKTMEIYPGGLAMATLFPNLVSIDVSRFVITHDHANLCITNGIAYHPPWPVDKPFRIGHQLPESLRVFRVKNDFDPLVLSTAKITGILPKNLQSLSVKPALASVMKGVIVSEQLSRYTCHDDHCCYYANNGPRDHFYCHSRPTTDSLAKDSKKRKHR